MWSRAGGVLGAVPSAAVMGTPRIFPEGRQIQGCKKFIAPLFFLKKVDDLF